MNEITNIMPVGPATMSSREIAELCDKKHAHVMRDIRTMLAALSMPEAGYIQNWIDPQNGQAYQEFRLPRDLTMTLITGYSIPLRKKVIDRLDELERRGPSIALNDPAVLRQLLLDNVEKVLSLEAHVAELVPLADSYEFLTRTDGTLCITDAAKALNMRPKDLFAWLKAHRWIYRRAGNGHWVGYQDKIQSLLLDHRLEEVTRSDGSSKITEQVRITSKGMGKLGEVLAPEVA